MPPSFLLIIIMISVSKSEVLPTMHNYNLRWNESKGGLYKLRGTPIKYYFSPSTATGEGRKSPNRMTVVLHADEKLPNQIRILRYPKCHPTSYESLGTSLVPEEIFLVASS